MAPSGQFYNSGGSALNHFDGAGDVNGDGCDDLLIIDEHSSLGPAQVFAGGPAGRRSAMVETFATHMAAIAKKLEEDDETGEQRFTCVRSGPDHFSLAFTYNVVAWERGWVSD